MIPKIIPFLLLNCFNTTLGVEAKDSHFIVGFSDFFFRGSEGAILRSGLPDRRRTSPEKEERYYTTRGVVDNIGKDCLDGNNGEDSNSKEETMWPKLFITLSSKEKEEDFMAMKGCKPSHRPKKRAKLIQRSLLVSFDV